MIFEKTVKPLNVCPMQNAYAELLQAVEAYIKKDELNDAINALFDFDQQTQVNIRKDLMLFAASHQQATNMFAQRLIGNDQFFQEVARVRLGLLNLVETMPVRMELNAQIKSLAPNPPTPNDANLEKIISGQNYLLPINWLEKAFMASRAVCRVVCADGIGTGFLTKEGYLFTCNHIIPSPDRAKTARIEFNYEVGFDGIAKTLTTYELDSSDFKASPHTEFDFTRVKVIDRADAPLSQWGFVEFEKEIIPSVGENVTIIQHPGGADKKIALHASKVLNQFNQHLFYTTNTAGGSAGSPVFNIDWKVVAIHHAGKTDESGGFVINDKGERRGGKRGVLVRDIFKFIG